MSIEIKCTFGDLKDPKELKPHPLNPNQHSEDQLSLITYILKAQGWRDAIVVSKRSGYIVTGHGRVEASIRDDLGQVPVEYQEFESEEQEFAHMVADNELAKHAKMDHNFLKETALELGIKDLNFLGKPPLQLEEIPQTDLVPKSLAEVDSSFTFKIKCSTHDQLKELQSIFSVTGESIGYDKFVKVIGD